MNQKYKFNPKTGKMEPLAVVSGEQKAIPQQPKQIKRDTVENEVKLIDGINKQSANIPIDEGKVIFRETSDLTIFQIIDEGTGTVLGYISGYALDINFNMGELNSVERVEQFINGIGKMFRSVIMEKIFNNGKE